MHGFAVQHQFFKFTVRGQQDRATGGFVDAVRFHTDQPILDNIDTADAVCATEFVEISHDTRRRHLLAVDRDWRAAVEFDLDIGRLVRGVLG